MKNGMVSKKKKTWEARLICKVDSMPQIGQFLPDSRGMTALAIWMCLEGICKLMILPDSRGMTVLAIWMCLERICQLLILPDSRVHDSARMSDVLGQNVHI